VDPSACTSSHNGVPGRESTDEPNLGITESTGLSLPVADDTSCTLGTRLNTEFTNACTFALLLLVVAVVVVDDNDIVVVIIIIKLFSTNFAPLLF
jgi:hypothetical protein